MKKITYVQNDEGDWCGIYVDGELAVEGHSIAPTQILHLVGAQPTVHFDYAMRDGRLPRTEDEL